MPSIGQKDAQECPKFSAYALRSPRVIPHSPLLAPGLSLTTRHHWAGGGGFLLLHAEFLNQAFRFLSLSVAVQQS